MNTPDFEIGDIVALNEDVSDSQAKFGRGEDPRFLLDPTKTFKIRDIEVHSYHTLLFLENFSYGFNSVCFHKVNMNVFDFLEMKGERK